MWRHISRVDEIAVRDKRCRILFCLGMLAMTVLMSGISNGYAFNFPWGQSSPKKNDIKKPNVVPKEQGQSSVQKTQVQAQAVKNDDRAKDLNKADRPALPANEKQSLKGLQEKDTGAVKDKSTAESVAKANAGGGGGSSFTMQKLNQLQKFQKLQSRDGADRSGSNLSMHELNHQLNTITRVDRQIKARQGERIAQLEKVIEISKIHQQILASLEKKSENGNKPNLTVSDTDEILRQEKIRLIREENEKNKNFVQALAEEETIEEDANPKAEESKDAEAVKDL